MRQDDGSPNRAVFAPAVHVPDVIQISIRWRGGATRKVECPLPLTAPDLRRTPAALVEQVRLEGARATRPDGPTRPGRAGCSCARRVASSRRTAGNSTSGCLREGAKSYAKVKHVLRRRRGCCTPVQVALFHLRDAFRVGDVWLARSRRYGDIRKALRPLSGLVADVESVVTWWR